MRFRLTKNTFVMLGIASFIGCDQVTKNIAKETLATSAPMSFANDIFRLTYAENTGVFLGLGKGLPDGVRFGLFTVMVGVVLLFILVDTLRRPGGDRWRLIAITMILAGGFGNLIDRIINDGVVIDFMNMGLGSLRTGIFNVADVFITSGALLFLALEIGRGKEAEASSPGASSAKASAEKT